MYTIVADSTVDLPADLADELGLVIIPFIFTIDGKDYEYHLDGRDMAVNDFYAALRAGKTSTTTQHTVMRYIEYWEPILKAGKDVLYLSQSAALSKSYDQSIFAREELLKDYPNRKIISLDTKSASLGQGVLAYYACKAQKAGKSMDEVVDYINSIIPNFQHLIMADDLYHLRRGGRVSGAAAFVGTMLNVKPILTLVDDGRLVPVQKVRGRHRAIKSFVTQMVVQNIDVKNQIIVIGHSDSHDAALELKDTIISKFGNCEFIINYIGPVIGSHTGPGTMAVAFIGGPRQKV